MPVPVWWNLFTADLCDFIFGIVFILLTVGNTFESPNVRCYHNDDLLAPCAGQITVDVRRNLRFSLSLSAEAPFFRQGGQPLDLWSRPNKSYGIGINNTTETENMCDRGPCFQPFLIGNTKPGAFRLGALTCLTPWSQVRANVVRFCAYPRVQTVEEFISSEYNIRLTAGPKAGRGTDKN